MRFESSVTSISWIPSEAVRGMTRLPFDLGVTHYDQPPPDRLESLEELHAAGAFRFANRLSAWIEVDDGEIVGYGHSGRSYISSTLVRLGGLKVSFQPVGFPDLRPAPEVAERAVRFLQTSGGRPGVPAPRAVAGKPFLQWRGPNVWTTLALTLAAEGAAAPELVGASAFPRHWVYDANGRLMAKSGVTNFATWYRHAYRDHSPWGGEDSPVVVAMAESALERQLSATIMSGGRPRLTKIRSGTTLVEQGEPGEEMYLLLDGLLAVEVDGESVAEVGPGAVVGERALLEGGTRTATLRAVTDCRIAVARSTEVDRAALAALASDHRREAN